VTAANIILSGLQVVDGVTLVEGDRVLVAAQTDARQNGVYTAATSIWVRAVDFDGNTDVVNGTAIYVAGGTLAGLYRMTAATGFIVGETAITFPLIVSESEDAVDFGAAFNDFSFQTYR
jgi:phage-related tail fiber protein